MDASTGKLIEFALDTNFESLDAHTIHECKRRLIDGFACAVGSFDHPLSQSTRALASQYDGASTASIWGTPLRVSTEMAAYANGVMLRVGENSDTFIGKGGGGHPSDMIPGMVAVAESSKAGGRSLITATVIAYDAYCQLMEVANLGARGLDQAVHAVLGSVLGVGKIMDLTASQMGHAISLALAPNLALRQTRHGALSSWKGCAGANAVRNAIFAASLAKHGVEGPSSIFEGKQGLWSIAGKFEWPSQAEMAASRMVTRTSIKCLPVCYHTQSAALAALDLYPRIKPDSIAEVHVETYQAAFDMAAGDPGQWAPGTPESADHSLPFVVATALANGDVDAQHFRTDCLTDARVTEVMRRVKVSVDPALTERWPETAPARVTVRNVVGELQCAEVIYPNGHVRHPMSDIEVGTKFKTMFAPKSGEQESEDALAALWRIESADDLTLDVLRLLRICP
jgi:2-methylcitrate dehydratase